MVRSLQLVDSLLPPKFERNVRSTSEFRLVVNNLTVSYLGTLPGWVKLQLLTWTSGFETGSICEIYGEFSQFFDRLVSLESR